MICSGEMGQENRGCCGIFTSSLPTIPCHWSWFRRLAARVGLLGWSCTKLDRKPLRTLQPGNRVPGAE